METFFQMPEKWAKCKLGQISKNYHKRSNKIFATKANSKSFTIETPSFPVLRIFAYLS